MNSKPYLRPSVLALGLALLFPLDACAHLIAIEATRAFPDSLPAGSTATASFTVTNISSKANVTVVDQSRFPTDSGVSVSASTCGQLLTPGQSCSIDLNLNAGKAGRTVSAILRAWAKPSADGVQYPITVRITDPLPGIRLKRIPVNSQLPAMRQPVVAINGNDWLIVSGSLVNFHDFGNQFNDSLYVYNPSTMQLHSVLISNTDLPAAVIQQLASSDPAPLQDGNTLYLIGGFYNDPNNTQVFTTLQTITSIDVPGMSNAILSGQTQLAQYVHYNTSIPEFRITGGQLEKAGNDFYMTFGQRCEGNYCAVSQTYTNSIYRFRTDPTLASINIVQTASHDEHDNSGWRRRDYTLSPVIFNNMDSLFAFGGPFTPGNDALVWTNGISFSADLIANDRSINQQANQYLSPLLPMYSVKNQQNLLATFSGLSNIYWSTSGLAYDNTTPYGNVLDLIRFDAQGRAEEFVNTQAMCSEQPLASCLYQGLTAVFVPLPSPYNSRGMLLLDDLPHNQATLVGYVYAGMLSDNQSIFATPSPSYVTNDVYAVYVTPDGAGTTAWRNVTDLHPGN